MTLSSSLDPLYIHIHITITRNKDSAASITLNHSELKPVYVEQKEHKQNTENNWLIEIEFWERKINFKSSEIDIHLGKLNIIIPSQYCFIKGKSCLTPLLELFKDVTSSVDGVDLSCINKCLTSCHSAELPSTSIIMDRTTCDKSFSTANKWNCKHKSAQIQSSWYWRKCIWWFQCWEKSISESLNRKSKQNPSR